MQNCANVSNIMLIMQVKSNALQWVFVYCTIGFGDSYFKASFYTVLHCILYQNVKSVFFLCTLSEVSPWACCWLAGSALVSYFVNTTPVHVWQRSVLGLNEAQGDVCMCSLNTDRNLTLLFISSVMTWAWRDPLKSADEWTWCYFCVSFCKCFSHVCFFSIFYCVSFVLPVRVLVLKVFVKRELYFFFQINRITE